MLKQKCGKKHIPTGEKKVIFIPSQNETSERFANYFQYTQTTQNKHIFLITKPISNVYFCLTRPQVQIIIFINKTKVKGTHK